MKKTKKKVNSIYLVAAIVFFAFLISLLTGILKIDINAATSTENVTPANYYADISTIGQSKSVILFTSSWCGPCNSMISSLKQQAKEFSSINFYELDIESFRDKANSYGVFLTPSIVVSENGKSTVTQEIAFSDIPKIVGKFVSQ